MAKLYSEKLIKKEESGLAIPKGSFRLRFMKEDVLFKKHFKAILIENPAVSIPIDRLNSIEGNFVISKTENHQIEGVFNRDNKKTPSANITKIIGYDAELVENEETGSLAKNSPQDMIKKKLVPLPAYKKMPGDIAFLSQTLSGDDQLVYTLNRGRNAYGHYIGKGAIGEYVIKLKKAFEMAVPGTFTAKELDSSSFDSKTKNAFLTYQEQKKLKDVSGIVGPETLKALDADIAKDEAFKQVGLFQRLHGKPDEQDFKNKSGTNQKDANKNTFVAGQVGDAHYDMNTEAGRIMYAQHMNRQQYGKEYTAPKTLLQSQYIEQAGGPKLLSDADKAVKNAYSQIFLINQKLTKGVADLELQKKLYEQKKKLTLQILLIWMLLKSGDRETGEALQEKLEQEKIIQQKAVEIARPILGLTSPVIGGTTTEPVTASMAPGIGLGAGALSEVIVPLAMAAVIVGVIYGFAQAIYQSATAGGLYQLKQLIDDLTEVEVDTEIILRDRPVDTSPLDGNKPLNEPEQEPEREPKPGPQDDPLPYFPLNDVDTDHRKEDECEPIPVGRHLGGDAIHDMVADIVPPNRPVMIGGQPVYGDWFLKTKNFDAYSFNGELWEVKTRNYSSYSPFLKKIELAKYLTEMIEDWTIASACGIPFVFGTTDKEAYADLKKVAPANIDIRLINQPK